MKNFYKPGLRMSLTRLYLYLIKFLADILIFIFSIRGPKDNNITNSSKGNSKTRSSSAIKKSKISIISGILFSKKSDKRKKEQQQDEQDSYGQYLSNKIYEHQLSLANRNQGIKLAEEIKSKRELLKFSKGKFPFAHDMLLGLVMLLILFFLSLPIYSQPKQTYTPQALKIGDTIPQQLWDLPIKVVNSQSAEITLKYFRNKKLLILDFWATWCGPCIKSLYKLDSLQHIYSKDVQILPVSNENAEKVKTFLNAKGISLLSGYDDSDLSKYFPYRSLPHQVWIMGDRIFAITDGINTTGENLTELTSTGNVQLRNKIDYVNVDLQKPMLIGGNGGTTERLLYRSLFMKRIQADIGGISFDRGANNVLMYNVTLAMMLTRSFLYDLPLALRKENRIVFECSDSLKNTITARNLKRSSGDYQDDVAYHNWMDSNLYCYNLILPRKIPQRDALEIMKSDLRNFMLLEKSIEVKIENRVTRAYVLQKTETYKDITTVGGRPSFEVTDGKIILKNQYMRALLSSVSNVLDKKGDPYPVTDETGIKHKIDLLLEIKRIESIDQLNGALKRYGLEIVLREIPLEMIVLKDKTQELMHQEK
ncbi:TlpA family protein disulfide reductase [Sphingobacterium litopenaei]|uniref:Redoxin domain-containing protein n=1 Tax=Sphingobacterium litopenaei TaxID=2763500 RepID=A0ABR7YER2_9SPHI|nr:TlpA disulfide reductase family protein [Sphingobacterium litopenaei]MBD1429794.1 redoxin domain-containing protein [Sphingobacterium litopenaei]